MPGFRNLKLLKLIDLHSSTNFARGICAERCAQLYLFIKGYRILRTRFKTHVGEIDIIASRHKNLVFFEVKTRTCISDALLAVCPKSQNRIALAAQCFLSQSHCRRRFQDYNLRFDVIAVVGWKFTHIHNAWTVPFK